MKVLLPSSSLVYHFLFYVAYFQSKLFWLIFFQVIGSYRFLEWSRFIYLSPVSVKYIFGKNEEKCSAISVLIYYSLDGKQM